MTNPFFVNIVLVTDKGTREHAREYKPDKWKCAAKAALSERARLLGDGRCLINTDLMADPSSPEEHVVPQGTGIRWAKLPPWLDC
jgi:hypothetical protein